MFPDEPLRLGRERQVITGLERDPAKGRCGLASRGRVDEFGILVSAQVFADRAILTLGLRPAGLEFMISNQQMNNQQCAE